MIEDVLNKGIPNAAICTISNLDLIYLSKNPDKTNKMLEDQFEKYAAEISEKIEDEFELFKVKALCTHVDADSIDNVISFSPFFLYSPMLILMEMIKNVGPQFKDKSVISIKESDFEFERKINELSKINNERQLRRKYPKLHMIYDAHNTVYQKIKTVLQKRPDKKKLILEKLIQDGYNYDEMRKNTNVSHFVGKICNSFRLLMEKEEELKLHALSFVIPMECFADIDEDKFALYLATQYLDQADHTAEKQGCLYYVAAYFNEDKTRKENEKLKVEYGISPEGEVHFTITPKELYQRFKNILAYYPELNFIDIDRKTFEGMTLEAVEEYLEKYFEELYLNWDFLSPDDNSMTKEYVEAIRNDRSIEKEIDKEKLLDLFIEKKELFDSSSPYLILKGKNSFDGYQGYLYENGKIILEKFYDNYETKKIATGQAIYVMDIDNFREISKKSKREIIDNKLCMRITHRGNWQEKVLDAINDNANSLDMNKLKVLTGE